jgi:DNA repair exonuclease SbcCD ATPase subunit
MVGETHIIAFGQEEEVAVEAETSENTELSSASADEESWLDVDEEVHRSPWDWIAPALAILLVIGWSVFFGWSHSGVWPTLSEPAQWSALVAQWATPVLLVAVGWLIVMRNSRREATRFGDVAQQLSRESIQLEGRLVTVNRELSLAREFIAAQARDLDALGRVASTRLSEHAESLQSLIHQNGERVEAIGTVSETALGNMEKLRGQLPVIANSAKDVTNNIGNAGRAAHNQLGDLISGFKRLNEFGQASDTQVQTLRATIDAALAEFATQAEKLDEIASARFAALAERGEEFRTRLDSHEVEALAAIRTRADALREEVEGTRAALEAQEEQSLASLRARLVSIRDESGAISRALGESEGRALQSWQGRLSAIEEDLAKTGSALDNAESAAAETMRGRIEELGQSIASLEAQIAERSRGFARELEDRRSHAVALDDEAIERLNEGLARIDAEIEQRRAAQARQSEQLIAQGEALSARLSEFERQVSALGEHGTDVEARLLANLATLDNRMTESGTALAGTEAEIARLTEASVRLLELLQAASLQSAEQLPQALQAGEAHLESLEARVGALLQTLGNARTHGDAIADLVERSDNGLETLFSHVEGRQTAFEERARQHAETLESMRATLDAIREKSSEISETSREELTASLEQLTRSAQEALASIAEQGPATVSRLAEQLSEESSVAIDKAMRERAAEAAGQLEIAASHAAGVGREAAVQLREQLGKVNELVGNLERRVAHARARAEEQVDSDFSRRAALVTEALNSNAIDIAKALSTDVGDTAWAAYLRGDRGIFTRRAVSLLDNGEAREIAQLYERDDDFREHVSRYVHDFEAILRQVLSTRDGHALGVTLLSSDMGKLYVALAQGIERLRD